MTTKIETIEKRHHITAELIQEPNSDKASFPTFDNEADQTEEGINTLESLFNERYGSKGASKVDTALEQLKSVVKEAKAAANGSTPFDFDDSIAFSYRDAITALGNAINGLLSIQPTLIASEMAISTELVSPQIEKWSQAYLLILQGYQTQISALNPSSSSFQKDLATLQGDMSVANSASGSASTGLNGVLSMLTSGTSSKTSTYQSLIQQVSSVVTALLNAMAQNWS